MLKLCSHSLFPERERGDGEGSGGCLANKVLRDSFEMFDDFCLGVLKRFAQREIKPILTVKLTLLFFFSFPL